MGNQSRASPKSTPQSALLQAMRNTPCGVRHHAQTATVLRSGDRIPVELDGTYPLPSSAQSRFAILEATIGVDFRGAETLLMERPDGRATAGVGHPH
jgi:hypothetical protein